MTTSMFFAVVFALTAVCWVLWVAYTTTVRLWRWWTQHRQQAKRPPSAEQPPIPPFHFRGIR